MLDKRYSNQDSINATSIGKHFAISANKINYILAELGWIKKNNTGWFVTESGKRVGGQQSKYKTGRLYAHWPKSILNNKIVVDMVRQAKGEEPTIIQGQTQNTDNVEYRERYEGKIRTDDGHLVKSMGELNIDNWLYYSGVVHAYEKKPRIEEDVYPDFYLPDGTVYIEYWGISNDPGYTARREKKLAIYAKQGIDVIQLTQKDMNNLDDILPKRLKAFGINTEKRHLA